MALTFRTEQDQNENSLMQMMIKGLYDTSLSFIYALDGRISVTLVVSTMLC